MLSRDGMPAFEVQLLRPGAQAPRPPKEGDVGYDVHADLSASEGLPLLDVPGVRACYVKDGEVTINPGLRVQVPLGFAAAAPHGTYGRIAERSGLAIKRGIQIGGGVCDPGFRGEWCAIVFNNGFEPFTIKHGDRIAQVVLEEVRTPDVRVVDVLDKTARGVAGFGSSGA
jgi:dUTP pyrophosphatase